MQNMFPSNKVSDLSQLFIGFLSPLMLAFQPYTSVFSILIIQINPLATASPYETPNFLHFLAASARFSFRFVRLSLSINARSRRMSLRLASFDFFAFGLHVGQYLVFPPRAQNSIPHIWHVIFLYLCVLSGIAGIDFTSTRKISNGVNIAIRFVLPAANPCNLHKRHHDCNVGRFDIICQIIAPQLRDFSEIVFGIPILIVSVMARALLCCRKESRSILIFIVH
uniref:Uncharacterized protein n=1 Tax=Siphoviridae sp. ctoMB99 TaxID=2826459 RepID=A0A8S5N028_9CAUD|nr:MAG TPA: hypothetical protein [Siphoviridae sp. ctoMB99]